MRAKKRWFGDLGAVATLWWLTLAQVVAITTSTASIGMVQMLWYHRIWVLTHVSVMSVKRMESFNHWNSKMVMVTTLRLLASALIVIIEITRAAGIRGWSRSFSFIKQWQYQWKFMTRFCSMPFFKIHINLCLQSLIPYSSPLIICYPVDANLHMYSIIAVYALPFRVASMPAVRYDLNGGLPACLCCDSLYIRIIWLLVRLRNLCQPDMIPVSIYVE